MSTPTYASHSGASFCGHMSQWIHGWASTLFIDDNGVTYIKDFTSNEVIWKRVPLAKKTVSAAIAWRYYWLLLEDGTVVRLDDHDDITTSESWQASHKVVEVLQPQKAKCHSANEDSREVTKDTDNTDSVKLAHISAGDMHVIGCAEDGSAGVLSLPCDDKPTLTWSRFELPVSVRQVSCGKEHVLLLTDSGSVFSYGLGSRGQLGHGTLENCGRPCIVEALEGLSLTWVAAGGWHSLALSDLGDVYVWGWNESGQLGLPCKSVQEIRQTHVSKNQGLTQSRISERSEDWVGLVVEPCVLDLCEDVMVTNASCGSRHSAIITDQGLLLTTGWNAYGQLGHGDTVSRDSFTAVSWLTQRHLVVESVICGLWSTLVTVDSEKTHIDSGT